MAASDTTATLTAFLHIIGHALVRAFEGMRHACLELIEALRHVRVRGRSPREVTMVAGQRRTATDDGYHDGVKG